MSEFIIRCIKDGEIEILPFDSGSITLTGCKAKDTEMTVALAVNSAAPNDDRR